MSKLLRIMLLLLQVDSFGEVSTSVSANLIVVQQRAIIAYNPQEGQTKRFWSRTFWFSIESKQNSELLCTKSIIILALNVVCKKLKCVALPLLL